MSEKIEIKGIREGIMVTLGEGDWPELHKILLEHIDRQGNFLKSARLTLDVGNQIIKETEMSELRDQLTEREIVLWAVISDSPTTESSAQALGLATRLSNPAVDRSTQPLDTSLLGEEAVLSQRTLRSGHSLIYPGHVIVIGDVNPGAEIIAGGNILVWGRLRGTVHAGAGGDEEAVVCALDLSPTQLRIAEVISIAPTRKGKPQPEMARLIEGQVVAESWSAKGKS
jgi:septum site-determining protein MinC